MNSSFLMIFEKFHQNNIKYYYLSFKDETSEGLVYCQQFKIGGRQIKGYQKKNNIRKRLSSYLLGMLNFKIIAFGNNFLTNEPSVFIKGNIKNPNLFLNELIAKFTCKECVSKFIFPDHFFKTIGIKSPTKNFPQLIKVEVEEDMSLNIRSHWKSLDDYTEDLNKKYRKRIKRVFAKSKKLEFKTLSEVDLKKNQNKMQILFNNVRESSAFYSVPFNVSSYTDFQKIDSPKSIIYGCYLEGELVAFYSEWIAKNKLYSYFIGLDYTYSREYNIYDRILYNTIENGIKKGVETIVFGRTATEFKSNFGAIPKKSFIYIYLKNPVLRFFLRPILSFIKPKKWTQRNPFKN